MGDPGEKLQNQRVRHIRLDVRRLLNLISAKCSGPSAYVENHDSFMDDGPTYQDMIYAVTRFLSTYSEDRVEDGTIDASAMAAPNTCVTVTTASLDNSIYGTLMRMANRCAFCGRDLHKESKCPKKHPHLRKRARNNGVRGNYGRRSRS
ncbi:MAG: hypothetical protein Q9170_001315 [Blastenia crenularia]